MTILVVGATGFLGTEICRRLTGRGDPLRVLVRDGCDPDRLATLRDLGAETALGDLRDRSSLDRACTGIEVVFSTATSIAREGEISAVDRDGQLSLVEAAREAGVRRFLYVSFEEMGTGAPIEEAKRAVEERLRGSGMTYTILQPGLFHETWLTPVTGFDPVGGTVNVYGSGEATLSWVALTDVATAAVGALDDPETENAVIPLVGDRRSYQEIVQIFEQATGRELTVQQIPEEALAAQRGAATDEREESFAGLAHGVAGGTSGDDGLRWLRRLGVEKPVTVADAAVGA